MKKTKMSTFKLSQKTTLQVALNKYGKVSAEIMRSRDNAIRRLYLHKREMEGLLMLIPQINNMVKSCEDGDIRVQLSGSDKYVTVSLFRGKKYIGVHTYKDGQRLAGRCMNLDVDEWDKLTSKRKQIADALKVAAATTKNECTINAVTVTQSRSISGLSLRKMAAEWWTNLPSGTLMNKPARQMWRSMTYHQAKM